MVTNMMIIPFNSYYLIREKLANSTPKIVKTGVQEVLDYFERGYIFSRYDSISWNDLYSHIRKLSKSNDFDIRKWIYHLLCVYNDPINDMSSLINALFENIEIEASENIENISWIVAACGAHAKSQECFEDQIKKNDIKEYLTEFQIKLSSSSFREAPFYIIDSNVISKAISQDDIISPIWITKIYANKYKYYCDSSNYIDVSYSVLNNLIDHPSEIVRKYSMWAYAQDISSWETPIKLEDVLKQETGVLKWNLVKLFQNNDFIENNLDFIKEIEYKIKNLKIAEKEGIILGCKKLGYSKNVSDLLISWTQSIGEDNENLLLNLYSYFADYSKNNCNYYEITQSAIRNIDRLPKVLQHYYRSLQNIERKRMGLSNQINNFSIQNINNGNGVQNNDFIINNYNNNYNKDIDKLLKEIKECKNHIEKKEFIEDDIFEDFKNHVEYELKYFGPEFLRKEPEMKKVTTKFEEIKISKKTDRKEKVKEFLEILANVVTALSFTQNLMDIISFVKKILKYINDLIG